MCLKLFILTIICLTSISITKDSIGYDCLRYLRSNHKFYELSKLGKNDISINNVTDNQGNKGNL